jgi:hypothetical protein
VRNYQAIPPTPIGVFAGKASQIESGSSIGAADRCAGRSSEAAIPKHSFPRTNKNEVGLDRRGKSVLGFLKLETASIYGQRRRANLEDVALKLPGFFKT